MNRFFVDKSQICDGKAVVTGDDAAHIARVLRLERGDEVELCDGEGGEYSAAIESADRKQMELSVSPRRESTAEPECRITLFQCLPKSGKLELIIQKCVELGIYEIAPVTSKRCVVKLDGKDMGARMERYNRVAYEAAKQSKRGRIPRVREVASLDGCDFSSYDDVFVAYECERELTLKTALDEKRPKSAALIIGPEGGFEPEEVAALEKKGARAITLGNRILRTETAGMAATAMMLCLLEG